MHTRAHMHARTHAPSHTHTHTHTHRYARSSDFSGSDFKDAVLDRVAFDKSTFRQARFINSVLTGTSFEVGGRLSVSLERMRAGLKAPPSRAPT